MNSEVTTLINMARVVSYRACEVVQVYLGWVSGKNMSFLCLVGVDERIAWSSRPSQKSSNNLPSIYKCHYAMK